MKKSFALFACFMFIAPAVFASDTAKAHKDCDPGPLCADTNETFKIKDPQEVAWFYLPIETGAKGSGGEFRLLGPNGLVSVAKGLSSEQKNGVVSLATGTYKFDISSFLMGKGTYTIEYNRTAALNAQPPNSFQGKVNGSATTKTINIHVTGDVAVTLSPIQLQKNDPHFSISKPKLPAIDPHGTSSTSFTVTFDPRDVAGKFTDTLTIGGTAASKIPVKPLTLMLTGTTTALKAGIKCDSAGCDGSLNVSAEPGSSLKNFFVKLTNTGEGVLNITGVELVDLNQLVDNEKVFTTWGKPKIDLQPDESFNLPVGFTAPKTEGKYCNALRITSNASNAPELICKISGRSHHPVPIMKIDSIVLDYHEVELGFGFTKAIVVRNEGDALLTISLTQLCDKNPMCTPADLAQFSLNDPGAKIVIPPGELKAIPQTYTASAIGTHTIQIKVDGNDTTNPSAFVTLTGTGVSPIPIDAVLALDRSKSMDEDSGPNRKIDELIIAADLFASLLRASDALGLVRYNDVPEKYLALMPMDATQLAAAHSALSGAAVLPGGPLDPDGLTGIGGAMNVGASMLKGSPSTRKHVLVVLTDGMETEEPSALKAKGEIAATDPSLMIYSIGLGESVDPTVLQQIATYTDGRFLAAADLTGVHRFDLETFYFKIFSRAIGDQLVFDPTIPVAINGSDPIVIGNVRLTSSDRTATFIVLDEPELRTFYDLELIDPSGKVVAADSSVSGVTVHVARRSNYAIYRVQMPDVASAPFYAGDWTLRLTPNGTWSEGGVRMAKTSKTFINPFKGLAPVAFAVAAGSDYRMDTTATSSTTLPGAEITLTATFTDRRAPSKGKSVIVTATLPGGTEIPGIVLSDDGTNGDAAGGDGTWTTHFTNTSTSGTYQFLYRGVGENDRGETVPREDARWVALAAPVEPGGCGNDCADSHPARRIWWSFHLGYNIPIAEFRDPAEKGSSMTIDVEVPLAPRWAAYGMLGVHEFSKLSIANLSLNLRRYSSSVTAPMFYEFGPGIYRESGGATYGGGNLGLGVLVPVRPKLGIELAGNLHAMKPASWEIFYDATLGVRFRF